MRIELTTPALLFPAISLLLLAYTNRFLSIGQLIRQLKGNIDDSNYSSINKQISNLQMRVTLIIWMQAFGVASLLLCSLSMFILFNKAEVMGKLTFGISLVLMVISLLISFWEILISGKALGIELEEMKTDN
ncbi:MAG: DUF2721 domain-containing protein [Cyclobacteriaceae bacterium]